MAVAFDPCAFAGAPDASASDASASAAAGAEISATPGADATPAASDGDSTAASPADSEDKPIATIPPALLKSAVDTNAAYQSGAVEEIQPPGVDALDRDTSALDSASPATSADVAGPSDSANPADSGQEPSDQDYNPAIEEYEQHQSDHDSGGMMVMSVMGDSIRSPIGVELREARRELKSGIEADGLLVVDVMKGSPAAKAGLRPYAHKLHDALKVAAVVASFAAWPAVLAVPLLDATQVGESYDMIIGVDGSRVTNDIEFEDQMRDLKPGEIVYLSVVRDGVRKQLRVFVPSNYQLANW